MNKKEIIRTVTEIRFLTVFFLVVSFLPLEQTCVPGNVMLFLSPFFILLLRRKASGRIARDDLLYAGVFVLAIVFVTMLAQMTNCVKTYGVTQELPHEWKVARIDSINSEGAIFVKVTRALPVQLSEISVFVNGQPRKCLWANSYLSFIAPGEARACDAGVICTGNTTVEITAPGNNDTAVC